MSDLQREHVQLIKILGGHPEDGSWTWDKVVEQVREMEYLNRGLREDNKILRDHEDQLQRWLVDSRRNEQQLSEINVWAGNQMAMLSAKLKRTEVERDDAMVLQQQLAEDRAEAQFERDDAVAGQDALSDALAAVEGRLRELVSIPAALISAASDMHEQHQAPGHADFLMYCPSSDELHALTGRLHEDLIQAQMLPPFPRPTLSLGALLVALERQRVMLGKYDADHDDDVGRHDKLAIAAAIYALPEKERSASLLTDVWPWGTYPYKPYSDRIQQLIVAGQYIVAEIDRQLRLRERAVAQEEDDHSNAPSGNSDNSPDAPTESTDEFTDD